MVSENNMRRLNTLLDKEREALLTGDLDALAALVDDKSVLVEKVGAEPVTDADAVADVQQRMHRNQQLFAQSLAGIRAVADRFRETNALRREMATYDSNGRRCSIATPPKTRLEKRA